MKLHTLPILAAFTTATFVWADTPKPASPPADPSAKKDALEVCCDPEAAPDASAKPEPKKDSPKPESGAAKKK